jgi:hypothetical protein
VADQGTRHDDECKKDVAGVLALHGIEDDGSDLYKSYVDLMEEAWSFGWTTGFAYQEMVAGLLWRKEEETEGG